MPISIADLRRDYALARLDERDVGPDPIVQFTRWLEQAVAAEVFEPTAMTLATADASGMPDARMVLLKGIDDGGFVFYTDYRSRKATELAANPRAALVFFWPELERQVRVAGPVERVSRAATEAYFRSRPRGSRLGAWASVQSSVIAGRDVLEERLRAAEERHAGTEVAVPDHWGGFRVVPVEMELWQGRSSRLHDRIRYRRDGSAWAVERLSP
jgi:pyridoxamine 5'-phosphate oxidase